MKGHALNSSNDIFVGPDGSLAMVEDGPQTVQHVRTRLLFYRNEWFLDLQAGTPYFEDIFVKPVDLGRVEGIIKSRILETPGVAQLTQFFLEFDEVTRQLDIRFSAETSFGSIDNEEVTINV